MNIGEKKIAYVDDFFFHNTTGQVCVKKKNRVLFYSILTGDLLLETDIAGKDIIFFEFFNELFILSKNRFFEFRKNKWSLFYEFHRNTLYSIVDKRYIIHGNQSQNKVFIYDLFLKEITMELDVDSNIENAYLSKSSVCLFSNDTVFLYDKDSLKQVFTTSLPTQFTDLETIKCVVKENSVFIHNKAFTHTVTRP